MTLIEVAIASVLMVVIFGVGLSVSIETRDAWAQIYTDTGAICAARETLRTVARELATSTAAHVTITTGTNSDTLVFQEPVSLSGDTITWGADGTAARTIRFSVSNGRLTREVVNANGNDVVGRARLLVSGVDTLYQGQKGLTITRTNNLVTIALRVKAQQGGHTWRKRVTTSVLLRN